MALAPPVKMTAMPEQFPSSRRFQFRLRTLMNGVTGLFVLALTASWVWILATGNYCWDAFGFMMVAGGVSIGTLVFGVVPNGVLYFRQKQPGTRTSLVFATILFAILVTEIVVLMLLPMKGE